MSPAGLITKTKEIQEMVFECVGWQSPGARLRAENHNAG
jgi:hypothetical protein